MIPATRNGLSAFAVLSALQKYIRRGEELEAMRCAVEMMHSNKAFFSDDAQTARKSSRTRISTRRRDRTLCRSFSRRRASEGMVRP